MLLLCIIGLPPTLIGVRSDCAASRPSALPPGFFAGKGTAQQAFQAQHEQHVAQAEKQQRHDQLSALLAAHGLQLRHCQNDPSIERHLQGKDELSEEQLLAAARMQCQQAQQHRQQQQAQWQRSARESTMAQLLARAGLHSFYACELPVAEC